MAEHDAEHTIEALTGSGRVFEPPSEFAERALIGGRERYEELYRRSLDDPEGFWGDAAREHLEWMRPFTRVLEGGFEALDYRWFADGVLNVSANCLDRHLGTWRRNKAALIWEGDDGSSRTFTYQQLLYEVSRFANVLKKKGIGRGDRVAIYLPMVPELPIAMLACARIGAIHSVVFGGFSASALRERIQDCSAKLLITADEGVRGGRKVALKAAADEALFECPSVEACIVVKRGAGDVDMEPGRDTWWHQEINVPEVRKPCPAEPMGAEDPLFILYTSGSTGKPKGVLHTTAGYLLYALMTFKSVFDYRDEDVYWCTADIGWVTGHSYIVYGPLAAGATTLMFEGVPTYPDPGRFWAVVEKYRVNIFYTAPTAIRALMRHGAGWPQRYDLSSLRLLGTVGEPINPEVWEWYHDTIGRGEVPIVDTYWQTETGGIIITPLPGATPLKPGSASWPFFGIEAEVVREDGSRADAGEGGYLVVDRPWPGMLRGTWGDVENKRLKETYFERFPGRYFTGDGARVDADGDYWLLGRVDDVINVSGHRLGTAEIESALVSHEAVSEAAVVGYPHPVKGEGIHAYVVLRDGQVPSDDLATILKGHVRKVIGPIAQPDRIQFANDLPKTRSGKIMRRILRKIAAGEADLEALGDISTLQDPKVVKDLIAGA
ncbi:acetate--CoA ligase [Coriobacteriia bacterium Es71-Z0120]|uniref:acetate--CoA ligase n=1 Tax=Parvivirga hydrogeniphila TaxID=2939460 RepID=UPI002260F351|nr:acetate--CoA ligase [Parvivirga hydrogeniphila]MCL4078869.1 acetate--CoA ligase [Parvivirga hydrogeniphila]